MPSPRMTTRRWMIVVAIAAVVLLGVRLCQLRVEYRRTEALLAALVVFGSTGMTRGLVRLPVRTASAQALITASLLACGLPDKVGRADELVALNKVPSAARQAAAERAQGVRFARALFDRANKHYKLRGKDTKGREVRVLCDEEANFVQVTVSASVALKEVPSAVLATHDRTMRGAGRFRFEAMAIVRAERWTSGVASKTVLFEFIGQNARGERLRQVVRADGVNIGIGSAADW